MQRPAMLVSPLLKAMCWFLLAAYLSISVGYGIMVHNLLNAPPVPGTIGLCANSLTDPLATILQYGTPAGLVAVLAIGVLWQRRLTSFPSLIVVSTTFLGCTASLVTFGVHIFQTMPGFFLSDIVWWMKPFGRLAGV